MTNKILTIFTPLYNRKDKISNLYNSLLAQTNQSFEWLIIDDGSTDGVEALLSSFLEERKVKMRIVVQKNMGKHVAHNVGVKMCKTELFVCVDSDDVLVPTAVDDLLQFYDENRDALRSEGVSGIVAYKGYPDGKKIGGYPIETSPASLTELYQNRAMTGDVVLVFKTEVIKQYPFPVFCNERFLRESIAYDEIDKKYRYLIMSRIIYLADYYDDGLSKNASKLEIMYPKGAALFRWSEYLKCTNLKSKVRNLIAYTFFCHLGKNEEECKLNLGGWYPLFRVMSLSGYLRYHNEMREISDER